MPHPACHEATAVRQHATVLCSNQHISSHAARCLSGVLAICHGLHLGHRRGTLVTQLQVRTGGGGAGAVMSVPGSSVQLQCCGSGQHGLLEAFSAFELQARVHKHRAWR